MHLGGERFFLRAYTLDDLAMLVAWLDDVLPGRDARNVPPDFGADESIEALDSQEGRSIQVYAALRHHGVTPHHAADLAAFVSDVEWLRFQQVVFSRRRTIISTGGGEDLSVAWWGPIVESLTERGLSVESIAGLSLDQLDAVAIDGCQDERPGTITQADVQAMYDAAHATDSAVADVEAI